MGQRTSLAGLARAVSVRIAIEDGAHQWTVLSMRTTRIRHMSIGIDNLKSDSRDTVNPRQPGDCSCLLAKLGLSEMTGEIHGSARPAPSQPNGRGGHLHHDGERRVRRGARARRSSNRGRC